MLLYSIVLAHFCTRVTSPRLADTLLFSHLQFINTKGSFLFDGYSVHSMGWIYLYLCVSLQCHISTKCQFTQENYIKTRLYTKKDCMQGNSLSCIQSECYLPFFCFKYDNVKSSMPFPISISHSGTEYESPASSAIFLTLSIASITRSL